ncbi:LemA family protein [Priestia filamentosa]|uniref:LemA family protein n=1 Tax=Priestia filamentosa TaxID=1402861 RepID=A0A1X7F6X5_9BACI|nr:LemA family protein [Priestia filamentosa]AKO91777.1 LemA family protein [Priestia filamentosa]MDT3761916.1 LemA family protein [Priestia filamentosa]OXS68000.1 LemA family protein [Priestia filamentosa]RJS64799.1 LemA family protein [Priestia filamentosa]WCM17004.1 LemA family protein [Priestia filamentosa]
MKKWGLWVVLGVIVLLAIFSFSSYNGLVTQEQKVDTSWAQVENQLKRRSDLIPNLVETVKGYASQEKEVIQSVTDARAQLAGANTPKEYANADENLNGALNRLLVVVENYPNLKSNENFRSLMDTLEGTENRLAVARRDYNESVETYNLKVRRFPGNIMANIFGFSKKSYYEVSEKDQENPQVDFGSGSE